MLKQTGEEVSMSKKIKTLLVVDDDSGICSIVSETLTPIGFKVLQAKDGVEALKLLDAHHENIDILLTDMRMPRMNGKELLNVIQSWHPKVKVILMSGYPSSELTKDNLPSENTPYIVKPFTRLVLMTTVMEAMDK
jgi:DNA-binding NtrC family response regulator